MISVIGLGNAASAIAQKFEEVPQYNVYCLNDKVQRNSKYKFKLKSFESPEAYEDNIPNLAKFFKDIDERIHFIVMGSSYSSNYALGILEQLKDKDVELFFIQPDTEMLTGIPKLVDRVVFNILQQYARSGLLSNFTILSNAKIEESLGDVPIKKYYDTINHTIFSAIHYLNYFAHNEPEIGMVSKPLEINRIRTVGMLNMNNLVEKWLFDLDMERDICYYMCINEQKMEKEGGLHRNIVEKLKKKPKNAFRKISYAIYETPHDDFGFCVAHTNAIQQTNS